MVDLLSYFSFQPVLYDWCKKARCSSVVRAFAHGAMGRRIDPSWWTQLAISPSSQCSTTGVIKRDVAPW